MRPDSRRRAYPWGPVTAALFVALLAIGPLVILAVRSVARHWYWPALVPPEWSLRAWAYVLSPHGPVPAALLVSTLVALAVTAVAVVLAIPAAHALALHDFPGKRVLLFALLLPVLAPPLAAALGLHAIFLRLGLVDTVAGVVLVHLIPAVPYATLMLTGSFATFDPALAAQARTLGATARQTWTRVVLPAVLPGIAVAASFAFLVSWSQYLLTLLVGGGRVLTLPLLLVNFQRGGDEAVSGALALLFVAPTLVIFGLVARQFKEW